MVEITEATIKKVAGVLGAMGLAALALGGNPETGFFALPVVTLAASLGGNWAATLLEHFYRSWIDKTHTNRTDLNHDIQTALRDTFQATLTQMDKDLLNDARFQALQHEQSDQARGFLALLNHLKQEARTIFGANGQLDGLLLGKVTLDFPRHHDTIQRAEQHTNDLLSGLLARDDAVRTVRALLADALADAFTGYDQRFVDLFWEMLPAQWIERFYEHLKSEKNGTQAYRAYTMQWQREVERKLDLLQHLPTQTARLQYLVDHFDELGKKIDAIRGNLSTMSELQHGFTPDAVLDITHALFRCAAMQTRPQRETLCEAEPFSSEFGIHIERFNNALEDIRTLVVQSYCKAKESGVVSLIVTTLCHADESRRTTDATRIEAMIKGGKIQPFTLPISYAELVDLVAIILPRIQAATDDEDQLNQIDATYIRLFGEAIKRLVGDTPRTWFQCLFVLAKQDIKRKKHPLVQFVHLLAQEETDPTVKQQLVAWVTHVVAKYGLEMSAAPPPRLPRYPSLFVTLQKNPFDSSKTHYRTHLWQAGQRHLGSTITDNAYCLGSQVAQNIVNDIAEQPLGAIENLHIEVFIEMDWISGSPDQWKVGDDTLGGRYPVVLRLYDRTQQEQYRLPWLQRATAFQQHVCTTNHDVEQWKRDTYQQCMQQQQWTARHVVTLTFNPKQHVARIFSTILQMGIPVVLWTRRCDTDCNDVQDAFSKIGNTFSLADLPELIWQIRRQATDDTHPGRHLSLLYDDPTRPHPDYQPIAGAAPAGR